MYGRLKRMNDTSPIKVAICCAAKSVGRVIECSWTCTALFSSSMQLWPTPVPSILCKYGKYSDKPCTQYRISTFDHLIHVLRCSTTKRKHLLEILYTQRRGWHRYFRNIYMPKKASVFPLPHAA